jgi:hypothetical protein
VVLERQQQMLLLEQEKDQVVAVANISKPTIQMTLDKMAQMAQMVLFT